VATLDPGDGAGADPLRALRAVLNRAHGKLPIISLPVVGRDPAAVQNGTGDTAATDKTDGDKTDASDLVAASDLAGMTAALNALFANGLAPATPAATKAASAAAEDGAGQARSNSSAVTSADAALARREVLQADLRADATAQATVPATATTSSISAATALGVAHEPEAQVKAAPPGANGVDATSTQSQMAALQHNFAASAVPQTLISTPVTAPTWPGEFADKLGQVVMTGSDHAEFRIHPAEMGPVNVSISVAADQASVVITAAHAATREALEQALPQLRDLLASQGITLGQASVQSENRPSDQSPQARDFAPSNDKSALAPLPTRVVRLNGLVDIFA
jgi:flagellar hook-length control protein FliK